MRHRELARAGRVEAVAVQEPPPLERVQREARGPHLLREALRGAADLVDLLAPALRENREADAALLDQYHADMGRAYGTFAGLVERFYNTHFAESYFLGTDLGSDLRRGVMSVLAGDVWRHDNTFQDMLLNSRRRPRRAPKAASTT